MHVPSKSLSLIGKVFEGGDLGIKIYQMNPKDTGQCFRLMRKAVTLMTIGYLMSVLTTQENMYILSKTEVSATGQCLLSVLIVRYLSSIHAQL